MTEKIFNEKIERMGRVVELTAAIITLPKTLKLKTKAEALDLLNVLLFCNNPKVHETKDIYQINNEESAFNALKEFIKKGKWHERIDK